jgi:hypothetical protein
MNASPTSTNACNIKFSPWTEYPSFSHSWCKTLPLIKQSASLPMLWIGDTILPLVGNAWIKQKWKHAT